MKGNDKQLRRRLILLNGLLSSGMITNEFLAEALLNTPEEPQKASEKYIKQMLRMHLNNQYVTFQVYMLEYLDIREAIEKK